MLNMLRMDFRRMIRSKMFYIGFLCMVAGLLVTIITLRTVTDPELRQQAIDKGMEITANDQSEFAEVLNMTQTEALCSTVYNGGFFFMALYMVAVLFVCSDFGSGFAKNIFSYSGGRWRYFLSKLLCMAAVCLIWIVGTIVMFWLLCTMGHLKFRPVGAGEYGMFIGAYLLIGIAYAAQAIFLSVLLRSEGAGIAASILIPAGVVVSLAEMMLNAFGISIASNTLYGSAQGMTAFLVNHTSPVRLLIVTAAWLVIWTVVGILTLRRKDI